MPTEQTSPETCDYMIPAQSDVVYGDVVQSQDVQNHDISSQEPDLGNYQLYANVPSNNDRNVNDAVVYSDLQSRH